VTGLAVPGAPAVPAVPSEGAGKRSSDAGVSAVEVVLLTPVMMLMVMIIVGLGVMVNTSGVVDGAARDAARAGSIQGDTAINGPQSRAAALAAAKADIDNRCTGGLADSDIVSSYIPPGPAPQGTTSTGQPFQAIAYFKVTISCKLNMSGVSMFGMFGAQKTVSASFVAPVNTLQENDQSTPGVGL
jgi:hypothetical protein